MSRFYAGVGSRETPSDVLTVMWNLGAWLAQLGWVLRSGGADGADSAFEGGCTAVGGRKEIFLPWKNFNKNKSILYTPTEEAIQLASRIHPAWGQCSRGARLLHARNTHQILGSDLATPVDMVICWTMGGGERGGTATAMKLAKEHRAKVYNLYESRDWWDEMLQLAATIKERP